MMIIFYLVALSSTSSVNVYMSSLSLLDHISDYVVLWNVFLTDYDHVTNWVPPMACRRVIGPGMEYGRMPCQ